MFNVQEGASRADIQPEDPVISAFLALLADDIRAGQRVQMLPDDLARAMLGKTGRAIDCSEDIEGEVAL